MKYAIMALALMATPAAADDFCYPTKELIEALDEGGQLVSAMRNDEVGVVFYVFAKTDGRWIMVADSGDESCIVGVGEQSFFSAMGDDA